MGRKNQKDGMVYSTNEDFEFEEAEERDSLAIADQKLYVSLDRKQRKGKVVTLVEGFVGPDDELKDLGKLLKSKCGTGGAVKNGEIMVQGDFKKKIYELLIAEGYPCKMKGGN